MSIYWGTYWWAMALVLLAPVRAIAQEDILFQSSRTEAIQCRIRDRELAPLLHFGLLHPTANKEPILVPSPLGSADSAFTLDLGIASESGEAQQWPYSTLETALNGVGRSVSLQDARLKIAVESTPTGVVDIQIDTRSLRGWLRVSATAPNGVPLASSWVRELDCERRAANLVADLPHPGFARGATVLTQCGRNFASAKASEQVERVCIANENVREVATHAAPIRLVVFEKGRPPVSYRVSESHLVEGARAAGRTGFREWRLRIEDREGRGGGEIEATIAPDGTGNSEFLEVRGTTPGGHRLYVKNLSYTFKTLEINQE